MQSLLIYLPCIVILIGMFVYNGPLMILLFIGSLVLSASAYLRCEDKNYDGLGAGLSLLCALGSAAVFYQNRTALSPDAAFVLFTAVIVMTETVKKMKK